MEESQSETWSTNLSDTEDEQDTDDVQFEKFPSPTFNIHIHVPHYDSNNSKLYLPRIQPIINLHFDELARRLESNRNVQSQKSFYKTFQDLVAKISPKFGVVKFHFKTNSEQKDIEKSNRNNVTPNSSQRHSKDIRLKKNMNSKKSQNVATKTNEIVVINNNNNNNNKNEVKKSNNNNNNKCNNQAPTSYEFDKDIKLKNAVVVLTDICKTKNYKHLLERNRPCKEQSNDIESSCTFADKLVNNRNKQKNEAEIHSVKTENESCTSGSFTTQWNQNNFNISENYCTDSDINLQTEDHTSNKSHIKKINNGNQNFTALVEGWSFSDILNRFQVKCCEKLGRCVSSSNGVSENRSNNDEMDDNKLGLEPDEKVEENMCIEEEENFENEYESDNKLCIEINKSEIDLNEKDGFDDNVSETTESFSFLQYQNETVNDFLTNESDVLSENSLKECESLSKDIKPELSSNSIDLDSDECQDSGKEMNLNDVVDVEVKAHDLSSVGSGDIQESKFKVPETNKSSLFDVTHPRFHLELIKKEMKRRALGSPAADQMQENLKSEKSDVESSPSGRTFSPKKMKLANQKPEVSRHKTKESSQADFIPLNSSGSTEFYVTSLNEVKPSKCDAKDFKRKMLFGDRVNRFSRSDQLRIYKLKQEATVKRRNSINY